MITLQIDDKKISVDDGTTILVAARNAGIAIPSLCHFNRIEPPVTCFVCAVKIKGRDGFVPSCAVPAEEGMIVESNTDEVHNIRRQALELLLSHHNGDCEAPCTRVCPCSIDIPRLIDKFMYGDEYSVRSLLSVAMPFPAVLSHICSAPCENGCRRKQIDTAVSIKELHKFAALAVINSFKDSTAFMHPPTGKKVAIIGAGLAGLTAAYHLSCHGHACTVIEKNSRPGGPLNELDEHLLPEDILEYEIGQIRKCGVSFQFDTEVTSLKELRVTFDALVIACGSQLAQWVEQQGIRCTQRGVEVQKSTFATSVNGVFAVGGAIIPGKSSSRTVGQSIAAAQAIHRFLSGINDMESVWNDNNDDNGNVGTDRDLSLYSHYMPDHTNFDSHMRKLSPDDLKKYADTTPMIWIPGCVHQMPVPAAASEIAGRCLLCDCAKKSKCELRRYAAEYGARQNRYKLDKPLKSERRLYKNGYVYEPGKCILCGRCVGITEKEHLKFGPAFLDRGSDMYMDFPLIGRAPVLFMSRRRLTSIFLDCPTGALWKTIYSTL